MKKPKNLKKIIGISAGLFVVSSYVMHKNRLRNYPNDASGKNWDPIRADNPISGMANAVILAVNPGA